MDEYMKDDSDYIKTNFNIICRYPLVLDSIRKQYVTNLHYAGKRFFLVDTILSKNEYLYYIGNKDFINTIHGSKKLDNTLVLFTNKRILNLIPSEKIQINDMYLIAEFKDDKLVLNDSGAQYAYNYNKNDHNILHDCLNNFGVKIRMEKYPSILKCPELDYDIPIYILDTIKSLIHYDFNWHHIDYKNTKTYIEQLFNFIKLKEEKIKDNIIKEFQIQYDLKENELEEKYKQKQIEYEKELEEKYKQKQIELEKELEEKYKQKQIELEEKYKQKQIELEKYYIKREQQMTSLL